MLLLWIPFALGVLAAPSSNKPTATLSNGSKVAGTSVPGVNKWLGVPYAVSPPQRFSPPAAAAKSEDTIDATSFKPTCLQQYNYPQQSRDFTMKVFNNPNGGPLEESEDCLYLNVFAPTDCKELKPVLFWIYGGSLRIGSSSLVYYDGTSFAKNQDVVLVTINYRTNVFGFLNSPEIPSDKQNLGFLDQRFALNWVQDNIKAFGGDPTKVTIFGESAGAYSVRQLVAVPPSPLPFRAAILQSQGGPNDPTSSYTELLNYTDCTTAESKLDCLRAVPATTLKSILEHNQLAFPPQYDGVTAVESATSAFQKGTAAKVPLMMGTNQNEGTPFIYEILLGVNNITVEGYLEKLGVPPVLADTIAKLYPFDTVYQTLSALGTDLFFLCPTSKLARITSKSGYPTWRYLYDAAFENEKTFPGAGAYHSSEIPQVFGTYPADYTPEQVGLSKYMQTTWANFAKNPGSPGWPSVSKRRLGKLVAKEPYEITTPTAKTDAICLLLAPFVKI